MAQLKQINQAFEERKPKTNDKYVGIELEFYMQATQAELASYLYKLNIADRITIKSDSSICVPICSLCNGSGDTQLRDPHKQGYLPCPACRGRGRKFIACELCILVKQSDLEQTVKTICKVLKQVKAEVNESCGLHVHLDMRNRNPVKAYNNLYHVQKLLYKMHKTRKLNSPYAVFQEHQTLYAALADLENTVRYRGINVCSLPEHQTLEVRIGAGSIDAEEIINWSALLIRAVESRPIKRDVMSIASLFNKLKLNAGLQTYVRNRVSA